MASIYDENEFYTPKWRDFVVERYIVQCGIFPWRGVRDMCQYKPTTEVYPPIYAH